MLLHIVLTLPDNAEKQCGFAGVALSVNCQW